MVPQQQPCHMGTVKAMAWVVHCTWPVAAQDRTPNCGNRAVCWHKCVQLTMVMQQSCRQLNGRQVHRQLFISYPAYIEQPPWGYAPLAEIP